MAGLFLAFLFLFALPAQAEDYVFSPENCQFQITFPGEPYVTRRCHDQMPDKCDLMTSYTHVFGLDATLNFYVSCKEADPELKKSFTPDLMRTSLLARPNVSHLEVYDVSFNDTGDAIMGALFGAGDTPNGNDQMVYVAQIWVGDHSVMSFEGEMIGPQMDDADKMFGDVMASLRLKGAETVTAAPQDEEKEDEAGDDEDAATKKAPE